MRSIVRRTLWVLGEGRSVRSGASRRTGIFSVLVSHYCGKVVEHTASVIPGFVCECLWVAVHVNSGVLWLAIVEVGAGTVFALR